MNIRKSVIMAIEEKIREAQVNCDVEVALHKKDKSASIGKAWDNLWIELGRIRSIYKQKVSETEKRHLNSVLSKII